jgi:hypothetical protein
MLRSQSSTYSHLDRVTIYEIILQASAVIVPLTVTRMHPSESISIHIYDLLVKLKLKKKKLNSMSVVRKRTIPTEQPPLVGEVSANLCG